MRCSPATIRIRSWHSTRSRTRLPVSSPVWLPLPVTIGSVRQKLPDALSLFSGKRCVAIVTSVAMLIVSCNSVRDLAGCLRRTGRTGHGDKDLGPIGAGLYALLQPSADPHRTASRVKPGVLAEPWRASTTSETSGIHRGAVGGRRRCRKLPRWYVPGRILPGYDVWPSAAALAMCQTAKPGRKKIAYGLLLAGAFSAFFTGVTRPLEFPSCSWLPDYTLVHAILTGIVVAATAFFGWTAGFGFSAGFVDFFPEQQAAHGSTSLHAVG